jgi:hypothetical protein
MSNREIVTSEAILKGFEYDGTNLFTFQEWKKRGYSVIKGQKAFISTNLWKPVVKKDKESGKEEKIMIMTKASLFSIEQVKKIEM